MKLKEPQSPLQGLARGLTLGAGSGSVVASFTLGGPGGPPSGGAGLPHRKSRV